jgi:anion-transporting  ArsA/GET3 family ATPase
MSPTAPDLIAASLERRHILVVCGSGGVGKTTTSAALALRAALLGRRVLVCTIDPSRRLATSLGLSQLSDKPKPLSLQKLAPQAQGSLWAMTLDTKRTFDALVERYSASPAAAERILDNIVYRNISDALSGTHEYMAMEKLLELSNDERFDLVVLDTPPTRHALDFLEAPDRMMAFLDTSILRYFLKPYFVAGRLTLKVTTKLGAIALDLADKALGLQFLRDLSEFFLAFEGMYGGFKERATKVYELLRDPSAGFLLVASPARQALEEAVYFHSRLLEKKMPFVGFLVNRVHLEPERSRARRPRSASSRRGPAAGLPKDLAEKLIALHRDQQALARSERQAIARLEVDARQPVTLVPELDQDVHDLRGLLEVADLIVPVEENESRSGRAARA